MLEAGSLSGELGSGMVTSHCSVSRWLLSPGGRVRLSPPYPSPAAMNSCDRGDWADVIRLKALGWGDDPGGPADGVTEDDAQTCVRGSEVGGRARSQSAGST